VIKNKVQRRISGPKWEEATGQRKLHNEELHSLYPLPEIIRAIKSRIMRWAGHAARFGEINVYKSLIGIFKWCRPLGRPSHR
jgi:hypothetical protein